MKYEEYVSLIQGLEAYASINPKRYEYKVFGLALMGYGYFVALLLLLLTFPVIVLTGLVVIPGETVRILLAAGKLWFITIPLAGLFFGLLGGAVKALFSRVPEPEERELLEGDAPELFAFVRKTTDSLKAARPKKIFITDEFNASVATLPRFGMFGRKVYLRIGLPLAKALTPEQFEAVLAHEIGHISGRHGAFGKWAYQVHEAWGRFLDSQELNDHKFDALYKKFVNWFFPYFGAYSFVLMREHERQADGFAVELVGARPLGEALIALHTRESDIGEVFWKGINEENRSRAEPAKNTFSRLIQSLSFVDPERHRSTLEKAIEVPTDYTDSHPSLAERLRTMGYWDGDGLPALPAIAEKDAAEKYFGGVDRYLPEFDSSWDERIAREWIARYENFQEAGKRKGELQERSSAKDLLVEESLELAGLIADEEGTAAARPVLEKYIAIYPDNADLNYNLAGVMLADGDERGLEYIHKAIELDPQWKMAANDLAFQFLRSKGRFEEAIVYAAGIEQEQELFEKAQQERSVINASDTYEPHTLTPDAIENIRTRLKYYDEIEKLYVVRKAMSHYTHVPMHVLFIQLRTPRKTNGTMDLTGPDIVKIAVERLENTDLHFIAALEGEFGGVQPLLDAIEGAKIEER